MAQSWGPTTVAIAGRVLLRQTRFEAVLVLVDAVRSFMTSWPRIVDDVAPRARRPEAQATTGSKLTQTIRALPTSYPYTAYMDSRWFPGLRLARRHSVSGRQRRQVAAL
jgi:hypothetical protein